MRELSCNITLCQSVLSGKQTSNAIFSATEMGVHTFIPIVTENIFSNTTNNQIWQDQSNSLIPNTLRENKMNVCEPINFSEALNLVKDYDMAILCYENEHDFSYTSQILKKCSNAKNIIIFIGPERGFSSEEVEQAKAAGVEIISLGKRIIRASHAGAAIMAMLAYELELH